MCLITMAAFDYFRQASGEAGPDRFPGRSTHVGARELKAKDSTFPSGRAPVPIHLAREPGSWTDRPMILNAGTLALSERRFHCTNTCQHLRGY